MRNIIPIIISIIVFNVLIKGVELLKVQNGFWILTLFWSVIALAIVAGIVSKRLQNSLI